MSEQTGPSDAPGAPESVKQPAGLPLLFVVEMWERFSYYGMRALLTLYMISLVSDGGFGWQRSSAGKVYGWYTSMVYLMPVFGGILADKLIGTHRSMVIGGIIIAMGHFTLATMGFFEPGSTAIEIPFFIGLALIIIGTGFFKPCVSVMVGQLYRTNDPRRDSGFTIFYMGINVGAFFGGIICGFLGQKIGWHWGFGAAGVGMLLGLVVYFIGRPKLLSEIGLAPEKTEPAGPILLKLGALMLGVGALVGVYAFIKYLGTPNEAGVVSFQYAKLLEYSYLSLIVLGALGAVVWFVLAQSHEDRGPTAALFIISFFVIFFWYAFEQAGTSLNVFAQQRTDLSIPRVIAAPIASFQESGSALASAPVTTAIAAMLLMAAVVFQFGVKKVRGFVGGALRGGLWFAAIVALLLGAAKWAGWLDTFSVGSTTFPASWFQSVNPAYILIFAPLFGMLWVTLGKFKLEPSTAVKMSYGLMLLAGGFVLLVIAARFTDGGAYIAPGELVGESGNTLVRVAPYWLFSVYLLHTWGELCLSPIGLSLVTKLAPVRWVSLMMGIWFLSPSIAQLIGGYTFAAIEPIEKGEAFHPIMPLIGGQADFWLIFVVTSAGAGLLMFLISPLLKRMMHGRG